MNSLAKIIICCCGLAAVGACLYAAPAKPGIITITQPDGSTLDVRLSGDEHFSTMTTLDGQFLQQDETGFYRIVSQANMTKVRKPVSKVNILDGSVPTTGELHGLVILAEYADYRFNLENPQEQFYRQLNEADYSEGGATGSARDYFVDQSNGRFSPRFEVVGPVTLSHNMDYYGSDNPTMDVRKGEMIAEACRLADTEKGVNFADYDNNGDGKADLVYVVYAGYAQSNGASSNTIWPHMWFLSEEKIDLTLDGVKIDRYACSSELEDLDGVRIAGIGTFCHEFSHTLGLPDLYATGGSVPSITMGSWDVLDVGCYNNGSKTPAGFSSYEKSVLGWLVSDELVETSTDVELPVLSVSNKAYKITSSANENEYYLLENRSKSNRWDKYLDGEGMLVIHVNYDKAAWENNEVNNDPNNLRVHLIPANNNFQASTDGSSIPFPGTKNVSTFSDSTDPSATFSDGTLMGRPLTNIAQREDGVVTFDFNQKVEAPTLLSPSDVTATSFVANWNPVEGAKYYSVMITDEMSGESKLYDKIPRTKFTFSKLPENGTFRYKVKATDGILESDYSEEAVIDLSNGGIESTSLASMQILAANGCICNFTDGEAFVYDMYGRLIAEVEAGKSIAVEKGIYIVKSFSETQKVVVK